MIISTSYLKSIKLLIPLFFFLSISSKPIFAQKENLKFGAVNIDELKKSASTIDPEAEAELLTNDCWVKIEYVEDMGWKRKAVVHRKIKIYNKEDASNWANVILQLYGKDEYSGLKVLTHNLIDGQVITEKLDKKDIFKEKVEGEDMNIRFAFPNVKDGSILEFKYTIISERILSFPTWYFQYTIPVVNSSYKVSIPEYFKYQFHFLGYDEPTDMVVSSGSDDIIIGTSKSKYQIENIELIYKDVKPLKQEAYVFNLDNYRNSIRYELASIKYPMEEAINYTDTWATVAKKLMDSKSLGVQLNRGGYLKDFFEEMNAELKGKSDKQKMRLLFDYVRTNIKWNKKRALFVEDGVKKTFDKGIGNSAEINLLLINMLRKAGLKANPLVLSTTDNGTLNYVFPSITQLNYLITLVEIDGKNYLMDAAHEYSNINTLPEYCLNYRGFKIFKGGFQEVEIANKSFASINISSKIDVEGFIKGSYQKTEFGQVTISDRNELDRSEEDLISSIKEMHEGISKDGFHFENKKDVKAPLVTKYDFDDETNIQKIGDRLFVSPLLYLSQDENPLKQEERKYPVEIGSSIIEKCKVQLEIPDGYVVEYIPESIRLELPDKFGTYYYSVSPVGNSLEVVRTLELGKPIYNPSEAAVLRQLFLKMIEIESDKLILIKE
jgi:hypothetical protein